MDTPCHAPLPVGNTASASCDQYSPGIVPEHPERLESSEHVHASSTDEQSCSGEYPSFLSKTEDIPRHSMVLPHQKGLEMGSLGDSAKGGAE